MNTIEVFETGKVVQVPGSWSEMTPKQVREVFRIFEWCLRHGKSPLEFNVRVLWMLLGVRRTVKGWFADIFAGHRPTLRDENVYLMCERFLGFLFSEESAALTFDSVAKPYAGGAFGACLASRSGGIASRSDVRGVQARLGGSEQVLQEPRNR